MKIPKTIDIGSYTIPVKIVDDPMDGARGRYDTEQLIIFIKKGMNKQIQESVFFHECIEAINDMHDIALKEHQICAFEQEITRIFKQLVEVK